MSTQRIGVNLSFNADTKKAQTEIMNLQKQLNGLLSNTNLDKDINSIIPKIAELSAHLKNAINTDTGNLDFTKLNKSLKTSGTTLKEYGENLQKLGPKGQQAFLSLTKAVASAEVPIRKTNKLVKELGETLANTARWQLSSSVLHGFMGALQGAYGYAKDLNAALNDIQIVTGLNTEEMSAFAKEANKAAQALSATTVEYTKASLIYFQQGLSTQQVKERADITIKLSKITKQSADSVSNQLTAIWSNYYDGSKSLESYADALTALGAATASSSDEISKGLQKFSAVANTVGLSYEYAASALATLTANTRESADVVGTALKTLFARIQGLQLGETLDDGTTLNKYSEALRVVGVNIMDTQGQLKSMDTILDEIGGKWQKLGKDQQQALAQTVAGVRQYNQFMALMNNWNNGDSDSMQANLRTIKESEGALQNQADIYAKSWEAARDRVTAAMESIYDKLLKDEFFIDLTNGVEKVISFVDLLIDRLGGLQGVLFSVGAIVTKVFSSQISQGLTNAAYNISMMTKKGQEKAETERMDYLKNAKDSVQTNPDFVSKSEQAMQDQIESSIELQQLYLDNVSKMTLQEQELNKILIDRTNLMREQAVTASKSVEVADSQVEKTKMKVSSRLKDGVNIVDLNANIKKLRQGQEAIVEIEDIFDHWDAKLRSGKVSIEEFKSSIAKIGADKGDLKDLIENFASIDMNAADAREEIDKLLLVIQKINNKTTKDIKAQVDDDSAKSVDEMTVAIEKQTQATYENKKATEAAKKAQEASEEAIKGAKGAQKEWADIIVESVNVALSMASAITMVSSAITTLSDPDVSGWDKFLTILTTLSMLVPTLISVFKTLQSVLSTETIAKVANTLATWKMEQADRKAAAAKEKAAKAAKKNSNATSEETVKKTISEKFGDFKEKSKQGWNSFTKPLKERNDAWNQSIWDKASQADKDKVVAKKMKKLGYSKSPVDGQFIKPGEVYGKNIVTAEQATEMVKPEAMKAMGGKAFGTMAGGVGLIAAGVAVAVGAIAWGVHQFTKYDKAAEEAAERSRQAAEAFQSVSSAYQSFTGNLSGYEEANKGLDELVKGTIEYKEALLQANESAQALIDSTKGMDNELKLGVDYDIDSDGRIKIKEESLERVQQEKLDNMQKASVNKQVMAISAQEKKNKADQIKLQREELKSDTGLWKSIGNVAAATASGAASGTAIGAGIGALGAGASAAPGAIIGLIAGSITGLVSGIGGQIAAKGAAAEEEQKAIDAISKFDPSVFQDENKYAEAIKDLKLDDNLLTESLLKNREAMQELSKNIQETNEATKALNKQMVANAVADNKKVQEGKHADDVIDFTTTFFEEDTATALAELQNKAWGKEGISKATKVNDKVREVFGEYAKAAGLEGAEVIDTTGTDSNRKFVYKIDGKEVTVSLEDMEQVVAQQNAAKLSEERAERLTDIFNNFSNEQSNAVTAAKTGEFTQLNIGQMRGEAITASSLGLDLETVKALGFETEEAFNETMKNVKEDAQNALADMSLPNGLFGLDTMSIEEAKKVSNVFEKINLGPAGKAAGEQFTKGLNDMLSGLSTEDQQAALNQLMTIDWSSWDALEQADAIMQNFGVDIDTAEDSWQQFASSMRTATGAIPDFSKMQKELSSIASIVQDLDFGSMISEEDYQLLVSLNDEWDRFFQMQMDGSRRFIGNADDMMKTVIAKGKSNQESLEERLSVQQEFKNQGYAIEDWSKVGENIAQAKLMQSYDGGTERMLTYLGYDDEKLAQIISEAESGSADARKQIDEMFDRIQVVMDEDLITKQKESQEVIASTATSFDQLKELFNEGLLGESMWGKNGEDSAFEKQAKYLMKSQAAAASSLKELDDIHYESIGSVDTKTRLEAYRENLLRLSESYDFAAGEAEAFKKAQESGDVQLIISAEKALQGAIKIGEAANEYGVNSNELEELTVNIMKNTSLNFDDAMDTAISYMLLAEKFGTTVEKLQSIAGSLSKDFSTNFNMELKDLQVLMESIGKTAEETGLDFAELGENTAKFAEQYKLSGQDALEATTLLMTTAEEYGISLKELETQTQILASTYNLSGSAAARLATQNQRMNQGMVSLIENWEDWQKTLKNNDKTSTDYVKTVTEMTSAIKDLIGASDDFTLPEGFLDSEEHLKLIEEAANGSAEAVNKLGLEITKEQIYDLEREANHQEIINQDDTITKWSLSETAFNKARNTIVEGIKEIQKNLDNLKPGDTLDNLGPDWIQAMNDMALATNMSVEEMNSMLNQMGVDVDVDVKEVKTKTKVPVYTTTEKIKSEENGLRVTETTSTITGYKEMDSVMQIASINSDAKVTYTGNGNVSTSTKATGGSTTKPQHVEDKKETKKRYETVDSKMEKKANAISDMERSLDTMYGTDRISQMKAVNDLLEDEVELLKEKNTEAKNYLKTDAESVTTAFKAVGIADVTFDENGNVQFPEGKDIEDYFATLDSDYATAVKNHNDLKDDAWEDGVITKEEQADIDASKEALDKKSKKIDEARLAWDKYLETLGIVNDTEDKKAEKENEIKANNYQAMVDELTLATEKNADALQEYDYYLNKVAEDYYSMSEAAGYMKNKLDTTQSNLTAYGNHYTSLQTKHAAGDISDADYYAGLAKTKDAIYGELEALQSLDAEMLEYYGNTLSMAGEEIGKYTEKIEQLSSVLDHYQSLLSIIGKENDFKSMGVVLSGITSTAKDAKDAAKAEYEFYAEQAKERKAAMDAATDDAAKEALKKEWEAAEAAASEAQDRMLSSTAEWAEAMKAVTENKLKDYAQTLEKALTGGTSFDDLTTSMERASSLQEEYLTSTNQIYETSKMMRDTQKAIDETTNQVAKNKLKAFMEETKQLQNQDKLSQHQLDIHQAEYELLMAEIALEEAQSAKSTVRLQRDAEGNFGYVYTADSSQVADAEQKVADAQNALYNKQLEGANNYTQKYQQTLSEMYDTMSTLQEQYLNGEIASEEEYNQKMLEAEQYYFQKLQDFSELYQISTTGNSAVIADAWSSDFADMTASTETWKTAVETYANNCTSAFTDWKNVITEVEKETGEDLTSLSNKVSNITSASKALADELTKDDGVIDKLEDELTAVTNVTNAYALQRSTLQDLIKTYEGYASTINTTLAGKKVVTTITTETKEDSTQPPPTGMATGGYTGEWGPEGKLAILHEKEIVLNAQDTENLLAAVGTLRVILNTIDTHSMSAQIGGMLSTPGFTGGGSEVLEQNVKIEASFPGVQDRNEIEEAFNNLINRASQYANRK